ncbi:MAG: hypothetical protein K8S27_07065 [Candidatus Omnitrophica bacterium]|nr:hypothetical protein [Candidatus Omnitrophota bacterium]
MSPVNDLIEWNDCGSSYSLYIKHFTDDEGSKGVTMIFEDLTHNKVTEIVIPPSKYPTFLRAINEGLARQQFVF